MAVRLDAAKYPSVSWDAMTFMCGKGIAPDDIYEVRLLDHATVVSGSESQASVDIDLNGEEPTEGLDYLHFHFRDIRYTITHLDCRFETQLTGAVEPAPGRRAASPSQSVVTRRPWTDSSRPHCRAALTDAIL